MLEEWMRKNKEDSRQSKWPIESSKLKYLLVIIISLGLLAMIWPTTKEEDNSVKTGDLKPTPATFSVKDSLTGELEAILAQIEGVGHVDVSLTLSSEGVKTYASNIRDEKRDIQEIDNSGIKKTTAEQNVSRDLAVSAGSPLLVEEKKPDILGVLVVAEGAGNPQIAEKLTNATATLLNISAHKVTVMPRKGAL